MATSYCVFVQVVLSTFERNHVLGFPEYEMKAVIYPMCNRSARESTSLVSYFTSGSEVGKERIIEQYLDGSYLFSTNAKYKMERCTGV